MLDHNHKILFVCEDFGLPLKRFQQRELDEMRVHTSQIELAHFLSLVSAHLEKKKRSQCSERERERIQKKNARKQKINREGVQAESG